MIIPFLVKLLLTDLHIAQFGLIFVLLKELELLLGEP
jgi:hypothetical protein